MAPQTLKRAGDPKRIAFLYWGRRGALTEFSHAIARAALSTPGLEPTISVSRQNESFERFIEFGEALVPVDTFSSSLGAPVATLRLPSLIEQMRHMTAERELDAVVTLMPHIFSPLVSRSFRSSGARYATIIHDASRHPGDPRGYVDRWTRRDAVKADVIFTLSRKVCDAFAADNPALRPRIVPLFHPVLDFGRTAAVRERAEGSRLRLLFLGRIMRYKGLGLLVESLERLRQSDLPVEVGIFGEGTIEPYRHRLDALGAEIVNRWLTETEVADALARYDAVALSHIEASQSGVAAAAFGAGLPVVATPVGGLPEQVVDGENGILANAADPAAFADAVARLATDTKLYNRIARKIAAETGCKSMHRLLELMLRELV